MVDSIPDNYQAAERQLRKIWLDDPKGKRPVRDHKVHSLAENKTFDCTYASHLIADIIPNAWQAREVVGKVVTGLHKRGFNKLQLGEFGSLINEELRKWLGSSRQRHEISISKLRPTTHQKETDDDRLARYYGIIALKAVEPLKAILVRS
ncbi:MAG: hypothetical protein M2R46_01619 [Verrucomicrobia subdivision 3 bacterium]|nr:hypothetical protein [Limisphaerales bacterium]